MGLKNLMGDITGLALWIHDYLELLPDSEEKIMLDGVENYLWILHQLIDKSKPEFLDEIQI